MNSRFGMATVCRPGYAPNKLYRAKKGQRQCLKVKKVKPTLKQLRALARANEVSIYKSRKDKMGYTRTPLTRDRLRARLTRMKVANFGMATVCRPGYAPNKRYRAKKGQRQCLKVKKVRRSLKELRAIARANDVSIYKSRKDKMGFTSTPLTRDRLKARLTRMKVSYK